jgi:hypothetical protein
VTQKQFVLLILCTAVGILIFILLDELSRNMPPKEESTRVQTTKSQTYSDDDVYLALKSCMDQYGPRPDWVPSDEQKQLACIGYAAQKYGNERVKQMLSIAIERRR